MGNFLCFHRNSTVAAANAVRETAIQAGDGPPGPDGKPMWFAMTAEEAAAIDWGDESDDDEWAADNRQVAVAATEKGSDEEQARFWWEEGGGGRRPASEAASYLDELPVSMR